MHDMVASLPLAVAYLAGRDHVFEYVNEEFRQLIGGRDVLGRPVRAALPELVGTGRFELMDNVLESGRPVRGHETELSLRRFHGDLEQVFVDFVYQPVRNAEGTPAGLWLFTADVTANVRERRGGSVLAAQLVETQERYRTLFETLPQGVIYYAADGLIMEANPAAARDPRHRHGEGDHLAAADGVARGARGRHALPARGASGQGRAADRRGGHRRGDGRSSTAGPGSGGGCGSRRCRTPGTRKAGRSGPTHVPGPDRGAPGWPRRCGKAPS